MSNEIKKFKCDQLQVEIYPSRAELGRAAARFAAEYLRRRSRDSGSARVVFACAPSQDDFLAALVHEEGVPWEKIIAFHMDEYVGLAAQHPASFRRYLKEQLLDHVTVKMFHPLQGECADVQAECQRYDQLLAEAPIDLICLGVGENGHIAFNDPPVADFEDAVRVKIVELDQACRQQQVNDGCFPDLDSVPRRALTLTISVFRQARSLSVVVPGPRKASAVRDALTNPISTACPASILRTHPDATLFLDADSAGLLPPRW